MLNRLKISTKLFGSFGILLALMGLLSLLNFRSAEQIRSMVDLAKDHRFQEALAINDTLNLGSRILANIRYAAETANQQPLVAALEQKKDFDALTLKLEQNESLKMEIQFAVGDVIGALELGVEVGSRMVRHAVDMELVKFVAAQKEFDTQLAAYRKTAENLRELSNRSLNSTLMEINRQADRSVSTSSAVSLLALLLGVFLAYRISAHIARPMKDLIGRIEALGQGDLSSRLDLRRSDEIGKVAEAMNVMTVRLTGMMERIDQACVALEEVAGDVSEASLRVDRVVKSQLAEVKASSDALVGISSSVDAVGKEITGLESSAAESSSSILQMVSSVEEVALNADQLSGSVDEVSSSIAQMAASLKQVSDGIGQLKGVAFTTSASIGEMDASIRQVGENARTTVIIAEEVQRDAQAGKESVEATIAGMNEIRESSRITVEVIGALAGKTENIGTILSTIDDITEQTNLLALNAAIIAAQAGERGKAFGVVAEEIRELAERTTHSTREIGDVVIAVQEETRRAVEAIHRSEARVSEGKKISGRLEEALNKIFSGIGKVAEQAEQVMSATGEQAQGSGQIRQAAEKVLSMVEQMAQAIDEQRRGGEMIRQAAEQMRGMTQQVTSATREQNQGTKVIAQLSVEIDSRIETIKGACRRQGLEGEKIVAAVGGIQESAAGNVHAAGTLNRSAEALGRQLTLLRQEMEGFRCADAPESPGVARKDEDRYSYTPEQPVEEIPVEYPIPTAEKPVKGTGNELGNFAEDPAGDRPYCSS